MDSEKTDRLRVLLQEALAPLVEKIEHLEKEIRNLKEEQK